MKDLSFGMPNQINMHLWQKLSSIVSIAFAKPNLSLNYILYLPGWRCFVFGYKYRHWSSCIYPGTNEQYPSYVGRRGIAPKRNCTHILKKCIKYIFVCIKITFTYNFPFFIWFIPLVDIIGIKPAPDDHESYFKKVGAIPSESPSYHNDISEKNHLS
jgi:hypothetical protein